jgi:hypothetical protein
MDVSSAKQKRPNGLAFFVKILVVWTAPAPGIDVPQGGRL